MTLLFIKLWISYYINNYIILFKLFINIQYIFHLLNLISIAMIVYTNCKISNYLLQFLSILDVNIGNYNQYSCNIHQLYLISLKDHINEIIIQIPNTIFRYFLHPFKGIDDNTWNEILIEFI
jgi:hypothetical protein